MRINQFIQRTGYCSRREADELIIAKRITVNGIVAQLGTQVTQSDLIELDGSPLLMSFKRVVIAYHKPVGIVSTSEESIKNNIIDAINYPQRIFPIGRLDKDSSGLILCTNDGNLVNRILRAEYNHQKEYIVTVNQPITPSFIDKMSKGVMIYNPVSHQMTLTNPCVLTKINSNTFKIILSQGLNRQIRRMCSVCGYQVKTLQRIRIMNIELSSLPVGSWRHLEGEELLTLLSWCNIDE